MKVKKVDGSRLSNTCISRLVKTGSIYKIVSFQKKNNECAIRKINKDEYMYLETGEIGYCNHIDNRGQNIKSLRLSVEKLRDIINTNFYGGDNELWITLTFGKKKVYNSFELYSIFEKFIKRLRYNFKNSKLDYIYVPEPHEKGDWHIHLLLKSDKALYIENSLLREIWGQGFVKVNRLKDIDNIGAYVSAYLTNIKDGEYTKKRC